MPELKRLNVPTEYNSNENLQAIPSPIKTLQDVRYFSLTMKYDPLLGIINRRLKDSKIQDRSLQNYKLLKQNLLVIQLKYSGPSVQTPTIMAVTPSQLTNGQVRIFSHVFKFSISNSQFQGIFNFDSKTEATTRSREVTSMAGIQSAGSSHMTGHLPTMEIKSEPMSIESCSVAKTFEVISISDLMNFIFFR